MEEEQAPVSIPPRVTGHLPNLASMCDRDFLELVCENGQILIRDLSSKITKKSNFPCSGYFSQSSKARIQRDQGEISTANRSNDGVADSTFDDPLSGLSSALTKLDRHDKNYKITSLQTGYPELLSELYEDGFDVVLKPDKKCYDKQLIDSNIVPVNKYKNFKQNYVSKLIEEIQQQTDSELPQSSLKQYEASIQFMRSKEKKLRIDEKSDRMNFSFLRPPASLKSNHPSSGATRPTSTSPGLAGAGDLEGNAGSTPRSSKPFEKEGAFMARNMKPRLPDSKPQKELLPDEQSEAVGYKDTSPNTRFPNKVHGPSSSLAPNKSKGNPGNGKPLEQMVASSSVCSRGASNCPTYTSKRSYEDTDLISENAMEEPKGTKKAPPARGSKGAKRKREAEVHNISERRRRDKINKKMRALQELIPNCNKVDKASMLDEAIEYLKTLQLQVQMMSMGTGVYMPPNPMMLTSAMQHINAQHLGGYSPMGVGMGMTRMQMGLGCGPSQFPTSLTSGAASLAEITQARLNMLGFPGQVLSRSPFSSLGGRFSPQSVQVPGPGVSQAAAIPLSTLNDSNPTH
ncbi:hypothetical protein REPUB_Repub12eG0154100 [Reevesia pubescens]